jgi:hypothetical protein
MGWWWWKKRSPWWAHYPHRGVRYPKPAGPHDRPDPLLQPGIRVRLRGKPLLVRRVLDVQWHWIRQEYVYIVETSSQRFQPYWFAGQLEIVN